MSIEVTMRHSDVRIESLKEYAEARMAKLKEKFPKVTKVSIVIDVDVFYGFAHPRNHSGQVFDVAHLADLLDLIVKIH